MHTEPSHAGYVLKLQIEYMHDSDVEALKQVNGVQVQVRAAKKSKRQITDVWIQQPALTAPELIHALLTKEGKPRARLLCFPQWMERQLADQVYWHCEAKEEAMLAILQRCSELGMQVMPTKVCMAKRGPTVQWLCNGTAQVPMAAIEGEALAVMRSEGFNISGSWEPHLLQTSDIDSKSTFHKAMACVPMGDTRHNQDQALAELHASDEVAFHPGHPTPGNPGALGGATEELNKQEGCVMTPVLYRQSMAWLVPVVPATQVASLACWLAQRRVHMVDVQPCDMQTRRQHAVLKCTASTGNCYRMQ